MKIGTSKNGPISFLWMGVLCEIKGFNLKLNLKLLKHKNMTTRVSIKKLLILTFSGPVFPCLFCRNLSQLP